MLEGVAHEYKPYDPNAGLLHWLHITISNANAFILGTYHGLPKTISGPIWTSIAFGSAAAPLAAHSGSVLPWLLLHLFGYAKGITT